MKDIIETKKSEISIEEEIENMKNDLEKRSLALPKNKLWPYSAKIGE